MRILIFGASGFIGQAVKKALMIDHEVFTTTRSAPTGQNEYSVDLLEANSVMAAINSIRPEVIINTAGIVDAQADPNQNVTFTQNILQAVIDIQLVPKKIIISGSAGEYGYIQGDELPVKETTPLRADTGYGAAKKAEDEMARKFGADHQLPVIVARIFNPIGIGMAEKFFVSRIKKQIQEYVAGERTVFEVSRKDSLRDYIAVNDVASAFLALVEGEPKHDVYNIGSGIATTNNELLQLMIESSKIDTDVEVFETSQEPELLVANQADISRIRQDLGWSPRRNISDTVEEIMNDQ